MIRLVLLTLFSVGVMTIAKAQITPDPDLHIYILMGQSNMAGRGVVEGEYAKAGSPRVIALNRDSAWQQARHPLHFDKPTVAGVGPGLAFGLRVTKAHRGTRIGLVPCAVGGTSIRHWTPGGYDPRTGTHPYDDALARIRVAMRYGVVKGVLWHQGESDRAPGRSDHYAEDLTVLIGRIRQEVGDPDLPFFMGELAYFLEHHDNINGALREIARTVPHTAVVSAEGLTHKGDNLHFDSPSATLLGERFAELVIRGPRTVDR